MIEKYTKRRVMSEEKTMAVWHREIPDLPATRWIKSIEYKSGKISSCAFVLFKNGYGLSIARGRFTYGGDVGLFEIAPVNKEGDIDGSLLDEADSGGNVCGWCDHDKVMHYIKKIGAIE